MTDATLAPWQVWWANFSPQVGHEQAGYRPAVVIGTHFACGLPNGLILVVPCTTTDRGLPVHPAISGLDRPTFAMCDQLKSISRQRLVRQHQTQIESREIEAIRFALHMIIDV